MIIRVSSYNNFITYLRSFPNGATLISSIRHNLDPAISFGLPTDKKLSAYQFVLHYQGLSAEYQSVKSERDPIDEVDYILKIANERDFCILPIEEGDNVTL